jgi:FMN-dependent NADH-azoreductase
MLLIGNNYLLILSLFCIGNDNNDSTAPPGVELTGDHCHAISNPQPPSLRVLRVDANARFEGSVTRQLADLMLRNWTGASGLSVARRDVAAGCLVDAAWVGANLTEPEARSSAGQALAKSEQPWRGDGGGRAGDRHPIYNFSVPASLKAWIDQIARARLTFRYTEHGPQGLLSGKKAFLVATAAPRWGAIDFAARG